MFFARKGQISKKTFHLSEKWNEISGLINMTGVWGFIDSNHLSALFTDDRKTIHQKIKNNVFDIPNIYKKLYFQNYTVAISSSLNSCHNFINISFQMCNSQSKEKIKQLLNNCGWDTTDQEIMFKIRINTKISGTELWETLYRLEDFVIKQCGFTILAGMPTYWDNNGKLQYSSILCILPILNSAKKRNDFNNVPKVDLNFIKNLLDEHKVPCRAPVAQPTSALAASAEASSDASEEESLCDNATAGPIVFKEKINLTKSPLQVTHNCPSASPTDQVNPEAGLTKRGFENENEDLLGDLQSSSYPDSILGNKYIKDVSVQLEKVWKSFADNDLRLKIGDKINRKKRIPVYITQERFIGLAASWVAVGLQNLSNSGQIGVAMVKLMFSQLGFKGFCMTSQNWTKEKLLELDILKLVNPSYSNFEMAWSKRYKINLDVLKSW